MKDCPVPLLPRSEGLRKAIAPAGGRHEIRNGTLSSRIFFSFFFVEIFMIAAWCDEETQKNRGSFIAEKLLLNMVV